MWVPGIANVRGDSGEKLVAVASTKVGCHIVLFSASADGDCEIAQHRLLSSSSCNSSAI